MARNQSSFRQVVRAVSGSTDIVSVTFGLLDPIDPLLIAAGYTALEPDGALPARGAHSIVQRFVRRGHASELVMVSTGSGVLESLESEARLSIGGIVASAIWISDDQIEVVFAESGEVRERGEFPPASVNDLPPSIRAAWRAAGVSSGSFENAVEVAAALVSIDLDDPAGTPRAYTFRRVTFEVPYGLEMLREGTFRHRLPKAVREAVPEVRRGMACSLASELVVSLAVYDETYTRQWQRLSSGGLSESEAQATRAALEETSLAAWTERDSAANRFQADPNGSNRRDLVAANNRFWACSVIHYAIAVDSELALLGVVAVQRAAQFHPDDWEGHFEQEDSVISALRDRQG